MREQEPKTELQKLEAKKRGIMARLRDPSISDDERTRAQERLSKTEEKLQTEGRRHGGLKAQSF